MLRGLMLCWLLVPGLTRAAEVGWGYVVTFAPEAGAVDVDWTLRGLSGEVRVCADMPRAWRGVIDPVQRGPEGDRRLPRDGDCWLARAPPDGPLRLRYRYALARMAAESGDPDYVSRAGDSYVFMDGTVLLRPDPLPRHAPIDVELRLPPGVSAATPWRRLDGPGPRFRYDSEHYAAGGYVAVGRLRPLGEVKVRGGVGVLTVLDQPRRAADEVLRRWVERALGWVTDFYGDLPGGRVHLVLVPVRSAKSGVFGSVLRRGPPSVVLYFGDGAEASDFPTDWVAPHELFHLGNPAVEGRIPWLIEGFTTYYQDVLRARGGVLSPEAVWGDLLDGFERFCQPEGGRSLAEESVRLRQTHRYRRVYWGGACLAFRLDVAIRRRPGGREGLDGVLRDLRRRGQRNPLTEEQIIQALDAAAGQPLASEHLRTKERIPLEPLYRFLGIERSAEGSVRLREDAPGAVARHAIF